MVGLNERYNGITACLHSTGIDSQAVHMLETQTNKLPDAKTRNKKYAEVIRMKLSLGDIPGAFSTINKIDSTRDRDIFYSHIATTQMLRGDKQFIQTALKISDSTQRDATLYEFGGLVDDGQLAESAADNIHDLSKRIAAYRYILKHSFLRLEPAQADSLRKKIKTLKDQLWILNTSITIGLIALAVIITPPAVKYLYNKSVL